MPKSPLLMGVLNMTPDSFSGDGLAGELSRAVDRAAAMVAEGADCLDIGGESTRPGAEAVSTDEELSRTIPLIEAVAKRFTVRVSIDTRHYEVAKAAVAAGATILNDISAGSDIRMASLAAAHALDVILMHMQGNPQTMQTAPTYPRGVVAEVKEFLQARVAAFEEAGVLKENIWVDPGIGFGKTLEHNLALMHYLNGFNSVGGRLVIGTSRKSFLAKLLGNPALPMAERAEATVASNLWAYTQGVSVFRVHDVGAFRRALTTWEAMTHVS